MFGLRASTVIAWSGSWSRSISTQVQSQYRQYTLCIGVSAVIHMYTIISFTFPVCKSVQSNILITIKIVFPQHNLVLEVRCKPKLCVHIVGILSKFWFKGKWILIFCIKSRRMLKNDYFFDTLITSSGCFRLT